MKLTLRLPSMPLLRKELTEPANRRRTYVVRTVYAVLLFGLTLLILTQMLYSPYRSPLHALGQGADLFQMLVAMQFAGIYLFLPAMMCGSIAQEKERNTLQLLLVTRLRPWGILLSKCFTRSVPMVTFLLMAMPLLAVAYAFGGITGEMLLVAVLMLLATCFQVAAICLLMSTWCATTAAAFVGSYLVGLVVYFALPVVFGILWEVWQIRLFGDEDLWFSFFPVFGYYAVVPQGSWGRSSLDYLELAWYLAAVVGSGVAALVLARLVFMRRALLPPKSLLRRLFRVFDRFFERANRITGGLVVVKDRGDLPGDRPVAWLEVHQRALGKARYLFRLFAAMEGPVFVILVCTLVIGNLTGEADGLSTLLFVFWPIAALLLAVQAVGAFATERRRQTLDVLLTTPMAGRQIVRQKAAAIMRLMLVLMAPLITLILLEAWREHGFHRSYGWYADTGGIYRTTIYLLAALLSVFIYLPMVAWLAIWVGMVVRHPTRAMLVAIGGLVAWCVVPVILGAIVLELFFRGPPPDIAMLTLLSSPATIIVIAEFGGWDEFDLPALAIIGLNFAAYGLLLLLFVRWRCLTQADRLLRRPGGQTPSTPASAPAPAAA